MWLPIKKGRKVVLKESPNKDCDEFVGKEGEVMDDGPSGLFAVRFASTGWLSMTEIFLKPESLWPVPTKEDVTVGMRLKVWDGQLNGFYVEADGSLVNHFAVLGIYEIESIVPGASVVEAARRASYMEHKPFVASHPPIYVRLRSEKSKEAFKTDLNYLAAILTYMSNPDYEGV